MGLFSSGKKAAKFTFVTMPLSLLGITALRMGNQQIAHLWKSIRNPVCPSCDKGVMVQAPADVEESVRHAGGPQLQAWSCVHCHYGFLAPRDIKEARALATSLRNERIRTSLSVMEIAQREDIAKTHRIQSRAYFVSAAGGLVGFLYLVASGAPLMMAFNYLAIGTALWTLGMKKSYRSWQARTGTVFVQGAFWRWLKEEKWLV